MKILLDDNHTPHAFMLAKALKKFDFFVPSWNEKFRPLPPNATILNQEQIRSIKFDATITDNREISYFDIDSDRKIFLQHCEHHGSDCLDNAMEKADAFVVVSSHKRATLREMGLKSKVHTIGFGFDVEEWPVTDYEGINPGTAFNGMDHNDEVKDFCLRVAKGFSFLVLGHHNRSLKPACIPIAPKDFPSYMMFVCHLSSWVFCVVGEAMGMAPLEAMAMGVPVIMGSYPESWDFCFNEFNCMISRQPPANCIDWIRDQVVRLSKDRELAARVGQNARKSILCYRNEKIIADAWESIL